MDVIAAQHEAPGLKRTPHRQGRRAVVTISITLLAAFANQPAMADPISQQEKDLRVLCWRDPNNSMCSEKTPGLNPSSGLDVKGKRAEPGGARFVDNRDGTIIDNETHLMWEKKIAFDGKTIRARLEGGEAPALPDIHDADNCYPVEGWCSASHNECTVDEDCPTGERCKA